MFTVPMSSVPTTMRMQYRVAEGQLRRSVRNWTEVLKREEVLDESWVHAIDRAITCTVHEGVVDTTAAYECLVYAWECQQMNILYLLVYARLLDRGYSVKFDIEYFAELPPIPDEVVERGGR